MKAFLFILTVPFRIILMLFVIIIGILYQTLLLPFRFIGSCAYAYKRNPLNWNDIHPVDLDEWMDDCEKDATEYNQMFNFRFCVDDIYETLKIIAGPEEIE